MVRDALKLTGVLVEEDGQLVALCPEVDVATFGSDRQSAKESLLEAVAGHIEACLESNLPPLRPTPREDDPRFVLPERIKEVFNFGVDVAVTAPIHTGDLPRSVLASILRQAKLTREEFLQLL